MILLAVAISRKIKMKNLNERIAEVLVAENFPWNTRRTILLQALLNGCRYLQQLPDTSLGYYVQGRRIHLPDPYALILRNVEWCFQFNLWNLVCEVIRFLYSFVCRMSSIYLMQIVHTHRIYMQIHYSIWL